MLVSINGEQVYYIDGVPTIIRSLKKNIAKGLIVQEDMTLKPCYVAKIDGYYAHAESLKAAVAQATIKSMSSLNIDSKIEQFRKFFKKDGLYTIEEFSKWHGILTGSCEMGRNNFIRNIIVKKYTVKEFLKKVRGEYGGNIIEKLSEYYNSKV